MTKFALYLNPHLISMDIPRITTEQMIEVDRLMIEEYGIELIQMMENAGRCLSIVARDHFFGGDCSGKNVVVLAGTGGNGGGALVCTRRLASWGANITVFITDSERLTPIPAHQYHILRQMKLNIQSAKELPDFSGSVDLIIDGIIGYSLNGNPRGHAASMIHWANKHEADVLSLDTPSGVSLTKGIAWEPVIRAAATLTLALPKVGLFDPAIVPLRGDLFLGDISVPPELYRAPGLNLEVGPIFAKTDILSL